jgi:hypothetical protein
VRIARNTVGWQEILLDNEKYCRIAKILVCSIVLATR